MDFFFVLRYEFMDERLKLLISSIKITS